MGTSHSKTSRTTAVSNHPTTAATISNDDVTSQSQKYESTSNIGKFDTNRNEFLVFGYVKQLITPELQQDMIIPKAILTLCHLFYNQFELFMFVYKYMSNHLSRENQLHLIKPHPNFSSINLKIKSIGKTFDYAPNDKPLEDKPWGYSHSNATFKYQTINSKCGTCFIPYSQNLISKNDINYYKLKECKIKHYSAFIKCGGYFQYGGMGGELTTFSSAIVFDSKMHSDESTYNAFEYVLPQTPFVKGCSLVYSNRNNSVISHFYEQNDCLYELKFDSDELKWCKSINLPSNFLDKSINYWRAAKVRMKYIENETLFMSTGVYSHGVFLKAYKFGTNEWMDLKRFSDKHHYVQSENYYYDHDRQSMYCSMWIDRDNVKECNQFNTYKNKWYKLPNLSAEGKNAIFWMNEYGSNSVLNVLLRPNYGETVIVQCLDLRTKSVRWQNVSISQDMLSPFAKGACFVYN